MNVPAALLALLRERMGLDPEILGALQIERAWKSASKNHADSATCLAKLLAGGPAWDELLHQVVVPETWFFREQAAFNYLSKWVRNEWLPNHTQSHIHVLSLPCATGEEVYSAAISVLEAGVPAARILIEGRDISSRAIAAAERGVYHGRSVRLIDARTAKHYFHADGGSLRVNDVLRACVSLKPGNLLHAPEHGTKYPVVFCRNLLIYLTPEARRMALRNLQTLLAPKGLLFLGHADTISGLDDIFERLPVDGAFAYRHRSEARVIAPPEPAKVRARRRAPSRILPALRRAAAPAARKSLPSDVLARAQLLADQGQLSDARSLLISVLKTHSELAEGWYLLGLVQAALGNTDEAALCYERTLSLEPGHHEASLHHALLQGERTGGAS